MSFTTDIQKEKFEKIGLVVLSPKARVTGWADAGAPLFSVTFTLGIPTKLWNKFTPNPIPVGFPNYDANFTHFQRVATVGALSASGQFHFDNETKLLTIWAVDGNPDTRTPVGYQGMTVEFEVHLSTRPVYGRRDPLSSTFTDVVDWKPVIKSAPTANNGTSQDLFGFQPVNLSAIEVINDGWMNPLLYDISWRNAGVKVYMLVGSDYEIAVQSLGVVQTFTGFVSGISESGRVVRVSCSDYALRLDQPYALSLKYSTALFPAVDPQAVVAGEEWYVRKIYGAVDGIEPVNVDYSATPSTTVNRDFITHLDDGFAAGNIALLVDDTQPNTATRTYFTTTPPLNFGDAIVLNHGTVFRVSVTLVNRALKYVEHASIVRVVSPGDTCARSYVGAVYVVDRNNEFYQLTSGDEFVPFAAGTCLGFSLKDNVEAGWLGGITFDPSLDRVYCRVYGNKSLPQYSDATDVGALSEVSGVTAEGTSLIFRVLQDAGFLSEEIDKDTFEAVGAESQTLGVVIPLERTGEPESYKEIIAQFLLSQLWKLGLVTDVTNGKMKLGLSAIQPFPAPFDYQIDKTELFDLSWEQDYNDIYYRVVAAFKPSNTSGYSTDVFPFDTLSTGAVNDLARDLHGVSQTYNVNLSQFDFAEAAVIRDRLSYVLGDRKALYRLSLPFTQLVNARIGVNYQVTRDHLPGFTYSFEAENQRTLSLVEVQKDLASVSLVLDDQKGVVDNSGDW